MALFELSTGLWGALQAKRLSHAKQEAQAGPILELPLHSRSERYCSSVVPASLNTRFDYGVSLTNEPRPPQAAMEVPRRPLAHFESACGFGALDIPIAYSPSHTMAFLIFSNSARCSSKSPDG